MPFLRPSPARGAAVPGLVGTLAHAFESLANTHGPYNPIGRQAPMGPTRPSAPVGGCGQGRQGSCIPTDSGMPSGDGSTDEASQNCMDDCQLNANRGSGKGGATPGNPEGLGDCGCDSLSCKRPRNPAS